ncbi:MAG: M23 family metallopeptidase [Frankiaceae bacterium]
MVKRLPRRALTLLFVALACFGVAACAVYSIRATANAGADIAARQVGARGPLPGGGVAGSSGQTGPDGPTGAAAPSNGLIVPDLFVFAPRPLSRSQRDAVAAQVGARGHVLFTDAGAVRIGAGTTLALGVEPRAFRVYTPANTASVAPLWRTIEAGELAVAHKFAKSQHLRLGGTVVVGPGVPAAGAGRALRIGAYATTGLPGVGAVVARSRSGPIGLIPGAGALVDFPPGTEAAVRGALHRAVPGALLVSLTRPASPTASTPGRPAPGPARDTHPWVLPAQGPVASPYGPRPGEFHPGIDLAAPLGAPIVAAADGVVTSAGPASGFGNAVVIANGNEVETVYGHMRYWFVRSGQRVRAGQLIALVGSEGHSTGPHLHFEVHLAGKLTDPAAWLAAHGASVPAR